MAQGSLCSILSVPLLGISCALLCVMCIEESKDDGDALFTDCGGTLKDTQGFISTPFFPGQYPIPLHCQWVIEAPADKVIALYFTQYYMREGLAVYEYAYFSDSMYLGKKEFGSVSSDHEPTHLVSNKPILVLEFDVREGRNVHLRVREHLLDVFGFNITYEITGRNTTARKDPCIFNHCSFTGSCLASMNFEGFYCKCFDDFFGDQCQFGPGCGPSDSSTFCNNGGTCRYRIGSTVKSCECPPQFEGTHCEIKRNAQLPEECVSLGCSQTCFPASSGDYKCSCFDGYQLSEDKKICLEKGRIRYLVSFKVYDQNVDLAHLDASRHNALKLGLESTLLQLFQTRLYKVGNLTVLGFEPGAVVRFHFFGETEQSQKAKSLFEENLKRGRIGRYAVDKSYLKFEWEPALSIHSIEPSHKMPVVQGMALNLICNVQGSSSLQVRWLKDATPIDTETPYRDIWTNLEPRNTKDQYAAILGIEETRVLDSGEFTCEVSDWGTVQNKSVKISVVTSPEPLVIPLTTSVTEGRPFVLTCLSEEDRYGNFGYNWLKNGRILNPSKEPELIEDLFPGGSRLLVKEARTSATYTCIITSSSGTSKKDSVVTVLTHGGDIPVCPEENHKGIGWKQAAANTEDIQPCPKSFTGVARRYCSMRECNKSEWNDPDFSNCISKELFAVLEKFHKLRMGYLVTNVENLLYEIRKSLWDMNDRTHSGSGEPVIDFLDGLQDYQKKRGTWQAEEMTNNTQIFIDIVSFLLEFPLLIQRQTYVIKLHQQILSQGLIHGTLLGRQTFQLFQRSPLVLEIGQIPKSVPHVLRFPSQKSIRMEQYPVNALPDWLTDSVELEFDSWFLDNLQEGNDTFSIAVIFYRNFSAFLPQRFVARQTSRPHDSVSGIDLEYQLHSRLVAVAMQTIYRKGSSLPVKRSINAKLKVKARLAHLNNTINRQILWNISCGMADFSEGNVQFSMDGCEPVQSGNFSLCQCDRVGTYAVLLTTYAQSEEIMLENSFDVIAGIGCGICAFFVCLTFFIFIVLWRKIRGALTALKIQFCMALIAAYGTILKALQESIRHEFYSVALPLVHFFLLASFCLQFCLCLSVYIDVVNLKGMQYQELKIAIIGWAFPMIVVGATLAAQVQESFKLTSWWLKFHSKHFYSFTASVLIILLLQIVLVIATREELKYIKKSEVKRHEKAKMRSKLVNRSLLITAFLCLASASSILYANYDDDHFKYAFAASSGSLGCAVFLCYTICSENVNFMCSSSISKDDEEKDEMKEELSLYPQRGHFEALLKPKLISDTYCVSKLHKNMDMESNIEQTLKASHGIIMEGTPKKHILIETGEQLPSCIVRDFTVHQPQVHAISEHGNSNQGTTKTDNLVNETIQNGEFSTPFELQRLEGSPKSSNVQLYDEENYELNHHGSAPDILETTNQKHTGAEPQTEQHSTLPRRCKESINSALASEDQARTVCSTFRQPDSQNSSLSALDVLSNSGNPDLQKQESDSDDQKPALQATPPCPPIQSMIGDDKFDSSDESASSATKDMGPKKPLQTLLKKSYFVKGMSHPQVVLNVPTPKVPVLEKEKLKTVVEAESNGQQSKKGWSMTAV